MSAAGADRNLVIARLLKRLGYDFNQPELLQDALRHRSVGSSNNERLEFLGDSVVNLVIAEALFVAMPNSEEGNLSRMRASLVRGVTLAEVATEIQLGEALSLGPGEMKSGGERRSSILADAFEAVVGAVFVDGGFEPAKLMILRLFAKRLNNLPDPQSLKDPKTRLQEFLQSRHVSLPNYDLEQVTGKPHDQHFVVVCRVAGMEETSQGQGRSRRRAEQVAAEKMLGILQHV